MSILDMPHPAVATWLVGEKEISVHKEQDCLTFSVKNGGQIERESQPISTEIYTVQRAEMLIRIFREVIQATLANGVSQYCFLPVLCTDAWILQEEQYVSTRFQAGLFGRIVLDYPKRGEVASKVVGARWGIFDPSNRVVSQFAVDEGSAAAGFLSNAFGRRGDEYDFYARQVKPIITCGADGRVTSIALKHFSTFDKNVMLDEDHWAVTLVSSSAYATVGCSGYRGMDHGHGMIAYEGVIENRQFLKFAHITVNDRVRGVPDQRRRAEEARVEILDRKPASLSRGPTWKRGRNAVENMLRPIREAVNRSLYVTFGVMSDVNERVSRVTTPISRWTIPLGALALGSGFVFTILVLRSKEPRSGDPRASRLAAESMSFTWMESIAMSASIAGYGMLTPRQLAGALVPTYRDNKLVFAMAALVAGASIALPVFFISSRARLPHQARVLAAASLFCAGNEIIHTFVNRNKTLNCISWCRNQLQNAGIEIHERAWTKIVPHAVVAYLRAHPEAVTLRERCP